ncbi:tetratricopeptide repeat protein [Fodinicola acaciae]|uniref:tetratricopeptide repeat protein n=1 Tax=Fodinicola acaciae TaxID=2681555 RepID=UPI0013D58B39|nr:tetratricopeptide repeat protein [Fodinicola acaciae]
MSDQPATEGTAEVYARAERFRSAGQPAEAARILEPVAAEHPDNAQVLTTLAQAYFSSAQLGRAEETLRQLVEVAPADHWARFVLGRTLERQGRYPEALGHVRLAAAMRDHPDYQATQNRLEGMVRDNV